MSDLYKFGYTLDETIKTMRDVIDTGNHDRMFLDTYYWLKMLSEYREIGTVEECREAAEKRKPKKPEFLNMLSDTKYAARCTCGRRFMADIDCRYNPRFCSKCGAKFDWSEEDE